MDSSLLKQTEAFKKRLLANPTVVEKRTKKPEPESSGSGKSKPSKKSKSDEPKASKSFDYKSAGGTTNAKFAALAKIVRHLRKKHQENDTEPLSLDEILDETNMVDLNLRIQHWLTTEALVQNPKVEVVDGDKYRFQPVLNVHDRKGLVKLLIQRDSQGLDGVLLDEVQESVPNYQKVLKILGDQVTTIERPSDKKSVLFYNNKDLRIPINEELQKLWRSVTVDGVDERNIEEYLQRHNITTMQDRVLRKASKQKRKGGGKKWDFKKAKTHNMHVGEVLKDYSDMKK
jgi:transcription initiation factor TFIIE subunit beta